MDILYSDGSREAAASLREAIDLIRRRFPAAAFYLEGSWPIESEQDIEEIESGRAAGRVLAWSDQASMDGPDGLGDFGGEAVAEILTDDDQGV